MALSCSESQSQCVTSAMQVTIAPGVVNVKIASAEKGIYSLEQPEPSSRIRSKLRMDTAHAVESKSFATTSFRVGVSIV